MKQTVDADSRHLVGCDVDVHDINDFRSGAENFITNFRTVGVALLRCYEGRYRIARKGCPVVHLKKGEAIAIYPGHVVTIDALEPSNRLVYGVFTGMDAIGYFNDLGCFDGLHCATLPRSSRPSSCSGRCGCYVTRISRSPRLQGRPASSLQRTSRHSSGSA